MTDPLVTAAEVAEMLGFTAGTVLDWFEAGRLPGFKIGRAVRFRESEVLAWLEARRVGPWAEGEVSPTPTARGSPWFLRLIRPLWESAELYRRTGQPGKYGFDEREAEHSMVLAACVAQEESLASERMAHHLKRSANRISRSLTGGIVFPEAMGFETT